MRKCLSPHKMSYPRRFCCSIRCKAGSRCNRVKQIIVLTAGTRMLLRGRAVFAIESASWKSWCDGWLACHPTLPAWQCPCPWERLHADAGLENWRAQGHIWGILAKGILDQASTRYSTSWPPCMNKLSLNQLSPAVNGRACAMVSVCPQGLMHWSSVSIVK